jgi:hypothetical protein
MIDPKEEQEVTQDVKSVARAYRSGDRPVPVGARLLDLYQAATYTGLSYWTLRDYVADGVLPAVRLPSGRQRSRGGIVKAGAGSNRKILIDREDLDRLIEESKERNWG